MLANPPHRSTLRIVGDLGESHTNRELLWANELHAMLTTRRDMQKSTWSLQHPSNQQWFEAVKQGSNAKELKEWTSAMLTCSSVIYS